MKAVVFCGDAAAAARVGPGAEAVAWTAEARDALEGAPFPVRSLDELLGPDGIEAVEEAAIRWTKDLGRRPVLDGRPLRDLVSWEGVSLWWFAELHLHHSTRATRYVRVIETAWRVLDALGPEEIEIHGLPADEAVLVARTAGARGVLVTGHEPRPPARSTAPARAASLWNEVKAVAATAKAALGGPAAPPPAGRVALFLSHAAFWRTRADGEAGEAYEHYFDRVLPETARRGVVAPFVVAVGPRTAFRRRGVRDRASEWLGGKAAGQPYVHIHRFLDRDVLAKVRAGGALARRAWRDLAGAAGLAEAMAHRGVRLGDLALADLAATFQLQLPWAVRSYEEMSAVLRAVRPAVVVLYAESSGWGRAAIAACRAQGVPTVAIQHGILYPTYFSYRHEPDEAACPLPDRTAVFGEAARRFLVQHGGYRPETLVTTGSPRFDQLLEKAQALDRGALRAAYGVLGEERLVVVASRFRGIRETHRSIGSAFPGLVRAIDALGARAVVKPHPAEPGEAYEEAARRLGSTRVRVVSPSDDLVPLLVAADLLVTVESLSAVEALVLGRPVVILNAPTNLRLLVEQGVALGVPAGHDPTETLRRALFDPGTRNDLDAARARYVTDVAMGADGGATARIAALIEETAARETGRGEGMVG
ncbi:MAG TPA: CDP-glycerol glycerophosphotransferase family protein [Vicinamibacteria bacterium]|nr:CDP-glycerol glycerophosphotransferase family protein [Vicinamibacteria bacterium]